MTSYAIFLDDTRDPPMPLGGFSMASDVVICMSFREFTDTIDYYGCPNFISFDHDLGSKNKKPLPTGMDCAKWLVNWVLDDTARLPNDFTFAVHSMNPAGAANIQSLMDCFLAAMKEEQYGTVRQLIKEQ